MSVMLDQGLRQRISQQKAEHVTVSSQLDDDDDPLARDQVVWGQTPSGQGAHIPEHPPFAY